MAKKHPYYPVSIDIEDRHVAIIGGGGVAERKAETLLRYGARITVIAPLATAGIEQWEREGRLVLRRKHWEPSDLDGAAIVIASTNDRAVNERIATDCRSRGIPVNVVDLPELCTFIVPAVIERGSIQIAVSTGGSSPLLARIVKENLQQAIGPEYAELNEVLGSLRDAARASPTLPANTDRKRFFDSIVASDFLALLRGGDRQGAFQIIARACDTAGVPLSDRVLQELEEKP